MNAVTQHQQAGNNVSALPADPMVSMIERLVLNPDADLDKLERMLALKRDHERDNARISFARALSAARAEIPPIMKDATVDFTSNKGRTHYRHETLAGIAKVIDPILSLHGLSYRFRTDQSQGGVKVTCVIAHADGHSEETSLQCAPDGSGSKNPFQAVGSAVTYLQRYTLKAALGLSAEEDDDAQGAAPRAGQNREQPRNEKPPTSQAEQTADSMIDSIRRHGADNVEADERFRHEFSRLRSTDAEQAARVDIEIANWREANKPRTGEIIDPNEIPY
ncbi:ERF family protein [Salipiger bermudensis]|uniref:ERF family protein n=1 Tax=Salipiger bermudensis TaxID=344736 RepID=UPI001CD519BC|nr:ERF family protein [Salipiger bermudensis]MCA0961180.1 ERF family protein [Salipiger bermudensis]